MISRGMINTSLHAQRDMQDWRGAQLARLTGRLTSKQAEGVSSITTSILLNII